VLLLEAVTVAVETDVNTDVATDVAIEVATEVETDVATDVAIEVATEVVVLVEVVRLNAKYAPAAARIIITITTIAMRALPIPARLNDFKSFPIPRKKRIIYMDSYRERFSIAWQI